MTGISFVSVETGVYLSNRPHFLWVYRRENPHEMLREHNHEPKASDLQAFRVFFEYPKLFSLIRFEALYRTGHTEGRNIHCETQ